MLSYRTVGLLVTLILYITPLFYQNKPTSRVSWPSFGLIPDFNSSIPIPCHSHNDYWRKQPLYSALAAGCTGVEADVWPIGDSLHVGHTRRELTPDKTLYTMYIEPLERILTERNFEQSNGMARGVFSINPEQTLVLLIDVKSHPEATWQLLLEELEPLREKGWLSRVVDGAFVPGPITVVGTGDSSLKLVESNPFRDVFLDAPLAELDEGKYSPVNSYYASVSFKKSIGRFGRHGLKPHQLQKLRKQIAAAHERGLKARYWGTPDWPLHARNGLWDVFIDEGVDFLNIDDLAAAREVFESRRRPIIL